MSAPKRIWLQWHGDATPPFDGDVVPYDVNWCCEKVFDHDIEYVLASEVKRLRRRVAKLQNEMAFYKSELDRHGVRYTYGEGA